jgi:hypothetical protein
MIYQGKNWAFNDYVYQGSLLNPEPFPTIQEGDVFISCNFTRRLPYTQIFETISDLTFLNCNLNGVDIKNSWVVDENCSYVQNEYVYEPDPSNLITGP